MIVGVTEAAISLRPKPISIPNIVSGAETYIAETETFILHTEIAHLKFVFYEDAPSDFACYVQSLSHHSVFSSDSRSKFYTNLKSNLSSSTLFR